MDRHSHPTQWSRSIWAAGEPFTLGMFFTPEAHQALAQFGLGPLSVYVAIRSAPMGQASAATVTAAFHGFPLAMIAEVLPDVWGRVTPTEVIDAHHASLPSTAERIFGDTVDLAEVDRIGELLTSACADLDTSGRPLAAGNQAIPPSIEPWARLWHACTTLREYRGDAHIAALVAADLSVSESLVLTAGWAGGRMDTAMLRLSRRLSDAVWAAAVDSLADRGLMTPEGVVTVSGSALREHIEVQTDVASLRPLNTMTAVDVWQLHRLLTALSTAMLDATAITAVTPVGAPWPPPGLDGVPRSGAAGS